MSKDNTASSAPTRSRLAAAWPIIAGLVSAPVFLLAGVLEDVSEGVVYAAVLYLLWGLSGLTPANLRWRIAHLVALAVFAALNVLALSSSQPATRYLLAAGWLGHAAWDVLHLKTGFIVPRWWAQWCVVIDIILAAILIFAPNLT